MTLHDTELEAEIVSAVFNYFPEYAAKLQESWFVNRTIASIVSAMKSTQGLNITKLPSYVEDIPEALAILSRTPLIAIREESLKSCIAALKRLFFLRYVLKVSEDLKQLVHAKESASKIVNEALSIEQVYHSLVDVSNVDYIEIAVNTINSADELIVTPFDNLRRLIGGHSRRALSVIGGKSGHNKTTFTVCEVLEQIKIGAVNKVLYVSVDEPGEMVMRRVIAKELKIPLSDMRHKRIKLNYNEVSESLSFLRGKLIIDDTIRTPDLIYQAILDIRPDRVIIDHLQELRYEDGISENSITYALKLFKDAAMYSGCNVTVLSQVRDKLIDERIDKVPLPHDFFYASTMRQMSREQSVLYWAYKDGASNKEYVDFIVYKSTYSDTGRIKFRINPEFATFEPILDNKEGEKAIKALFGR